MFQYFFEMLRGNISSFPGKGVFAYSKEFRSESENGEYAAAVLHALQDQKSFENFKRLPAYCQILEHVTMEQGSAYLDILKSRNDGLLKSALQTVLVSDSIGNPVKFDYEQDDMPPLSPTTLRYVKVASDLKCLFGERLHSVAEIGCGYGGSVW